MNLAYAIADLCRADDLLDLALSTIDKHAAMALAGARTVMFLGDYVERGPGSRQIIERLMAGVPDGLHGIFPESCLKYMQMHTGDYSNSLRSLSFLDDRRGVKYSSCE